MGEKPNTTKGSANNIGYALKGISTEKFEAIFEPSGPVEINLAVSIKSNYDKRSIGLNLGIRFRENGNEFLKLESTCHFEISPNDWRGMSEPETGNVTLPKNFLNHLASIAIGTARGILHSKTENTPYNKFFLPLIDVAELGGKDLVVKKE